MTSETAYLNDRRVWQRILYNMPIAQGWEVIAGLQLPPAPTTVAGGAARGAVFQHYVKEHRFLIPPVVGLT